MKGVGAGDFGGAKEGIWGHQNIYLHFPTQLLSFSKPGGIPRRPWFHPSHIFLLQHSLC